MINTSRRPSFPSLPFPPLPLSLPSLPALFLFSSTKQVHTAGNYQLLGNTQRAPLVVVVVVVLVGILAQSPIITITFRTFSSPLHCLVT